MRRIGATAAGSEKGVALVLTLLVLTLLVVTGLELNRAARVEATLAGNFRDLTQAACIARSGVEVARALIQGDDPAYDALDERWAQFEMISALSSRFFPEGYFTGRITDEDSRFNPGGILDANGNVDLKKKDQLERLLGLLGRPADWTDALMDWLDPDHQVRGRGAERDFYLTLKKPYPAKNGPLDTLEELLLVKGVDPSILQGKEGLEGLRNYLTVHSGGKININTASLPVLMSLSPKVDEGLARAAVSHRSQKPFKSPEDLRSVPGWETVFPLVSSEITVRSNFFSVEVVGHYREARSVVQAVLRRDGPRTRVLYWRAG
jgi:general secretion pathway protein K